MTNRQIEAARVAITRQIKRGGKMWIRVFPDKPVTKKPAETRMGKGKGAPEFWVAVIKPGRVLFELEGITRELARAAFELGASKLPIRTRFVERQRTGRRVNMATRVKTVAVREMGPDEIRTRVGELREELFNLRFRNSMKQLDNPLKIRESRREMARLLTVLKEKERAGR